MIRIACGTEEVSCIMSMLFSEIRPACSLCGRFPNDVVIKGITYEEKEEYMVLKDYGFDYSGSLGTIDKIRQKRCLYGK